MNNSLPYRDGKPLFKFWNWFRREATGPVPKLNGCRHSLPPYAQWKFIESASYRAATACHIFSCEMGPLTLDAI